jgi:HD superfamily phosphohydrolase YqeK
LTILNLGTILYIFDNLSQFYNFRKVLKYKYIIASSLEVPILSYSDVTVQVTKLDKSKGILYLKDIAFYTDFNTNLVLFYLL